MTATLASTPIVDEFLTSTQSHNVDLADLDGAIDAGDLIVMVVFVSEPVDDSHPQAAGFKRHGYQGDNTGLAYVLSRVCDGSEDSDVVDVQTEVNAALFVHTYHYEAATWSGNQQHGIVINYYAGSGTNANFGVSDTPLWSSDTNVSLLGLLADGGVTGVPSGYGTGLFNSFDTTVTTYDEYTGTAQDPGAFTNGTGAWYGLQVIIAPDGADIPAWPWPVNSVEALGTGSVGNLTVPIPDYAQADDIILLAVETNGGDSAPSAPSGYTEAPDSPQSSGTGAADKTRLSVFWKAHSGSESNPTITDVGDHQVATIGIIRGADTTDPFDVTNGGSRGTNSTTQVIVGDTTTVDRTLVVFFFSMGDDTFPLTIAGSDPDLDDLQQAFAGSTTAGNDGAVFGGHGILDTAGATGNITYTVTAAEELAYWLGAIQAPSGATVHDLAGTISGVASVAADLHLLHALTGSIDGAASLAGPLLRIRDLAGSVAGAGTLAGSILRVRDLTGEVAGVGSLSGTMLRVRDLAGSIDGAASLGGTLALVVDAKELSGSIQGVSDLSGSLIPVRNLSGQIVGVGALEGTILRVRDLTGEIAGQATLTGKILLVVDHGPPGLTSVDINPYSTAVDLDPSATSVDVAPSITHVTVDQARTTT